VYFVKGVRFNRRTGARIRTLPTLLIPLRGEIALDVRARSSVRGGRLVTTFPSIPDAPLSRFELSLAGGRSGILVANTAVCKARRVARVVMRGHNGRRSDRGHKLAGRC
jgi:hypothetical protein